MSDFKTYINQSWSQHAKESQAVVDSLTDGVALVTQASESLQLLGLVLHLFSEHVFAFNQALDVINKIEKLPFQNNDTQLAAERARVVFNTLQGQKIEITSFAISDQIKILATLSSALVAQNKIEQAREYFKRLKELAQNIDIQDSAQRSVAIAGNNLACALEEKTQRNEAETKLMIESAQLARKHWEFAGTWLEVERAEYRLSQSYFQAGDYLNSIKHANLCLTICEQHKAAPLEFFFAYESIAMIEKAMNQPARSLPQMQRCFELLDAGDKSWCEASLNKLK